MEDSRQSCVFCIYGHSGNALYLFYVISVLNGVRFSFTDWDGMSVDYQYVGFKNYLLPLKNPNLWNFLKTTLV